MATNRKFSIGDKLSVECSHPAIPSSGDPIRWGDRCGVALTDEADGGNPADYTSVDFGSGVWDMSVKGINDDGNVAVAVGDAIFYVDADTPVLSKKRSGTFFGWALETITSGSTDTIKVLHPPNSGLADAISGSQVGLNADDNVVGSVPVLHRVAIAAGAIGDTDVTLTHKTRVIDAWVVMTGAGVASCTLVVGNAANAITDAMDVSGSDKAIVRAAEIDDAQHEIAAAGTLRITTAVGATQPDCLVYVLGVRV